MNTVSNSVFRHEVKRPTQVPSNAFFRTALTHQSDAEEKLGPLLEAGMISLTFLTRRLYCYGHHCRFLQ